MQREGKEGVLANITNCESPCISFPQSTKPLLNLYYQRPRFRHCTLLHCSMSNGKAPSAGPSSTLTRSISEPIGNTPVQRRLEEPAPGSLSRELYPPLNSHVLCFPSIQCVLCFPFTYAGWWLKVGFRFESYASAAAGSPWQFYPQKLYHPH